MTFSPYAPLRENYITGTGLFNERRPPGARKVYPPGVLAEVLIKELYDVVRNEFRHLLPDVIAK
jgi:hypothetical protein